MVSCCTHLWRNAGCGIVVLVLASIEAIACSCHSPARCQPFQGRDATFVADVLSRNVVPQSGNLFRVRVVERFSGPAVGQEVLVETGLGGGDCAYIFNVGHRHIIDAVSPQNRLFTDICSLTGPATPENIVLRELREDAIGKRIPDVSGTVVQDGPPLKWGEERPLQGVKVSLQRANQSPLQTLTDQHGIYFFDNVSSGTYPVIVDGLPPNLAVSGSDLKPSVTDEIGDLRVPQHPTGGAACHLSISAARSGTITGRIGASRKILSDMFVSAYPIGKDGHRGEALCSRSPKDTGAFRLPYLPPGRYLLKFERGSKLIGRPIQVTLADGEQRDVGEIKLSHP